MQQLSELLQMASSQLIAYGRLKKIHGNVQMQLF